ncbi:MULTISPECIES: hypothetical protein [unclassified Enterobacter]|uniref:hypothetical protein n=1 Tax=unclassified Enterobacter TaxID=2608935 RepID=UPI0008E798E3|nr:MULTISPECIES: hypothetical protein [unclassified Enterobacter]SFR08742.1 hypothetical protein SAMN04487773_2401 [Enterobacter sp. kpr-6]
MARIILADAEQWQNSDTEVLQVILKGTCTSFAEIMGYELEKNIIVSNRLGDDPPMIFYPQDSVEDRENYKIALNIPDVSDWGEIIYQFSHEVGHAYCQYFKAPVHKQKWFEEALCEAIAMSNLHYMFHHWDTLGLADDPRVNALREEPLRWLNENLRDVPKDISTARILEFINTCLPVFEIKSITKIWDQDNTNKLRAISYYLCANLFYNDVHRWKAVKYFNEWDTSADKNFADFMRNWVKHGDDNVKLVVTTLGFVF